MQLGERSSTWVYDIDWQANWGLEFGRGLSSSAQYIRVSVVESIPTCMYYPHEG